MMALRWTMAPLDLKTEGGARHSRNVGSDAGRRSGWSRGSGHWPETRRTKSPSKSRVGEVTKRPRKRRVEEQCFAAFDDGRRPLVKHVGHGAPRRWRRGEPLRRWLGGAAATGGQIHSGRRWMAIGIRRRRSGSCGGGDETTAVARDWSGGAGPRRRKLGRIRVRV